MKTPLFSLVVLAMTTGSALAQEIVTVETIQPASVRTSADFTFDLTRTSDPSLVPLPAGAGDYELASTGEVQDPRSFTFDLN